MRAFLMIIGFSIFFTAPSIHAEYQESLEDSMMRAEILGENDGEILAKKHPGYQSDRLKEECNARFFSMWEEHFEEKGFKTSKEVATTYVDWCVKGYNKKSGK